MFRGLWIGAVLLISSVAEAGEMRTWIDRTGKHKIKAELVSYEKGNVTLKTADGKLIKLVVGKLSKVDREFVYKFHNPNYGKRKTPKNASDDTKESDDTEGVAGKQETSPSVRTTDSVVEPNQGKFTVQARAQRDGVIPGEDVQPIRFVLTFAGDGIDKAVAYGQLKIERFVDQNGSDLIPLFQFLPEDPQTAYVPFGSIVGSESPGRDIVGVGDIIGVGAVPPDTDVSIRPAGEAGSRRQADGVEKEIAWLVRPNADTTSIAQCKGTMKLKTGGERHQITLSNVGTDSGLVTPQVANVAPFTMELAHPTPDSLELILVGDVGNVVKATVADAGGTTVDATSASAMTVENRTTLNWTFANNVPADTQVVLELAIELQEVEVPFDLVELAIEAAR